MAEGRENAPETVGRLLWRRFRSNRLGYWSLMLFLGLYCLSLAGELVCNDRPLLVRYQGDWYFPLFKDYDERTFGGTLPIRADYHDPQVRMQLEASGNFALFRMSSQSRSIRQDCRGRLLG